MFSANIAHLQTLVANRKAVLHQKRLDWRRWTIRREILRDAAVCLTDLETAITTSHSEYGHTVVLRAYFQREMEERREDGTTLLEVLEKTDVLARVANCLAPGYFECHLRRASQHQRARGHAFYEVVARFHANGVEPAKPPCTCVCAHLTDGFCGVCGGHGVRAIMNPEDED
jgi:hypothetical protein